MKTSIGVSMKTSKTYENFKIKYSMKTSKIYENFEFILICV